MIFGNNHMTLDGDHMTLGDNHMTLDGDSGLAYPGKLGLVLGPLALAVLDDVIGQVEQSHTATGGSWWAESGVGWVWSGASLTIIFSNFFFMQRTEPNKHKNNYQEEKQVEVKAKTIK